MCIYHRSGTKLARYFTCPARVGILTGSVDPAHNRLSIPIAEPPRLLLPPRPQPNLTEPTPSIQNGKRTYETQQALVCPGRVCTNIEVAIFITTEHVLQNVNLASLGPDIYKHKDKLYPTRASRCRRVSHSVQNHGILLSNQPTTMPNLNLHREVALVVGSSRGIGRQVAEPTVSRTSFSPC
jgi:hypothetical protein